MEKGFSSYNIHCDGFIHTFMGSAKFIDSPLNEQIMCINLMNLNSREQNCSGRGYSLSLNCHEIDVSQSWAPRSSVDSAR